MFIVFISISMEMKVFAVALILNEVSSICFAFCAVSGKPSRLQIRLVPNANNDYDVETSNSGTAEQQADLEKFEMSFDLYTRQNPDSNQPLIYGDKKSVSDSNFDAALPTRVICHGWISSNRSELNYVIKENYFTRGDYNVIVADWSQAADDINYIKSAMQTRLAGERMALFIRFLVENANLKLNDTYLIGHSLGAHVVGFAGRAFKPIKINTIYGLDPAKPLFDLCDQQNRLNHLDADYVETIHTNGGLLGIEFPVGDASFYPHFGHSQPGCHNHPSLCDHQRSWMYFAESVLLPNLFFAKKCSNFLSILLQRSCNGTEIRMGGEPSKYGTGTNGVYYLPVNSSYPYAVGQF